jgi:ADP-ribose pyrophosphatase YjhB (NUDIX family)
MNERRIAVRGIVYKNNKILAVQHKKPDGTPVDFWATPGGGLDIGESLLDGLRREMIEETGITPKVGRLLFTQQFIWEKHTSVLQEQMEFFFFIENPEDYINIELEKTSHGHVELASIEFVLPSKLHLMPVFLKTVDLEDHIMNGKPVKHFEYIIKELRYLRSPSLATTAL